MDRITQPALVDLLAENETLSGLFVFFALVLRLTMHNQMSLLNLPFQPEGESGFVSHQGESS